MVGEVEADLGAQPALRFGFGDLDAGAFAERRLQPGRGRLEADERAEGIDEYRPRRERRRPRARQPSTT